MARKTGESREQYGLFATPLEEMIADDNPVRVIEAFVNALNLEKLGFRAVKDSKMGASSYNPSDLLKLYFYGYYNRIRSSRMLERECHRNVEVMWLLGRQTPTQHTISTFRTLKELDKKTNEVLFNHRKALVQVFRTFNQFLNELGLFGKKKFATDGTKIAAQNSNKRHISEDKIARKLQKVENRIEEYIAELDEADLKNEAENQSDHTIAILIAIGEMQERQTELKKMEALLAAAKVEDPHVTQICLTDPDARMLPINNEGMMQIAYNVQSVVDDQHCLIAHFSVENQKDGYLLAPMAIAVKEALGIQDEIKMLADKAYCTGKGIHECGENGIITYVAFPEQSYGERPKGFTKPDFQYDKEKDVYICPNKKELTTTGTLHEKKGRQGHVQANYKLYRCSFTVCSACPFKEKCLSKTNIAQRHGRTIERSEFEEALLANKQRILLNREIYKQRQAMVEHPFGTIKRSWGMYFTLLKRKEKVSGEMAIVFSCYNLRRTVSILGVKDLILALKARFLPKTTVLSPSNGFVFLSPDFQQPKFTFVKTYSGQLSLAA